MPGLNTTSTADISFMLLIFFLVTSSMDTDWGLPRQLPPPDDLTKEEELVVKQRNALCLKLDANNQLTCNDEPMAIDEKVLPRLYYRIEKNCLQVKIAVCHPRA